MNSIRYMGALIGVLLAAMNVGVWLLLRGDTWFSDYNLVAAGWCAAWALACLMEARL